MVLLSLAFSRRIRKCTFLLQFTRINYHVINLSWPIPLSREITRVFTGAIEMLLLKYHILISHGQIKSELMPISWCRDDSCCPNVQIQISYLIPGGKIKDKENKRKKLRFPLVLSLQTVTPVLHFSVEALLNSRSFQAACLWTHSQDEQYMLLCVMYSTDFGRQTVGAAQKPV